MNFSVQHQNKLTGSELLRSSPDVTSGALSPLPQVADDVLAALDPRVAAHPDFHDGWGSVRLRCAPTASEAQRARSHIVVTNLDAERLELVLSQEPHESKRAFELRAELARAKIVSPLSVPGDVITMNSRLVCSDESGNSREFKLAYPRDAQPGDASLSVLTPLGTALLGIACGDLITAPGAALALSGWRVSGLLYQPEREGHFHM